ERGDGGGGLGQQRRGPLEVRFGYEPGQHGDVRRPPVGVRVVVSAEVLRCRPRLLGRQPHQRGAGARRRVEDVGGRVAAAADRDVGDGAVVVGDEQAVHGGGGVPQQARGRGVHARSAQQHAVEAGRASGPGGERGQRVGARVDGGGGAGGHV